MIRVRGLTFTYPKATEPAVRGMDFSVGRGEIFGFLGPSGAGKSTTQKLLIGLLRGHGGEAAVWGKDPLAWGPDYYQRIGVSFELPNHYQKLTGLENLRFFASLYDGETLDPMELLDAVGLADDANTRVGKYSKGMQMRLTFVRSLINDPELLFLDEPTSGLDPVNARKVKNMVLDLKARGRTVFLTTHDMATADELCDRVAFVVDGQIVALDTPTELKIARSQRLVRVEYRGDNGAPGNRRVPDGRPGRRPGVSRVAARPPCRDHPQPGSQPRRRLRRGHRTAAVMTRLASALRLELTLQVRQRFLHAAVFSGLIWLAVLLPMSHGLRPVAEPYVLLGDISIIGFFFIAGTVFFEKQERTLGAVISTPLRFWEYLAAKLTLLVLISLFVAVVVATIAHGFGYRPAPLVAGVVLGTLLMLLVGFSSSLPFASISDWFLAATIPLAVMTVPPVLHYSGVWPNPMLYLVPTQGPMLLLGAAFDQVTLAPWQVVYAVVYPVAVGGGVVLGGQGDVRPLRHRQVGGHVMATSHRSTCKALAAFGRNDIRGTYRDPLLVMIVVAPVIWTTGVAILTPLFTEMLADRYEFDLVPYYPLILTAFLLLTSIIIVGGLAAFLVLDEVDAGTLDRAAGDPGAAVDVLRLSRGDGDGGDDRLRDRHAVVQRDPGAGLGPGADPDRAAGGPVGGGDAAVDRGGGEQQDSGHGDAPRPRHADRRTALPAVVHRLRLEPGLRCVAAILGGQGVLGGQRRTAPGGRICSSASSTTWPSPGRCFGASSPRTPEPAVCAKHEREESPADKQVMKAISRHARTG